MSLPTGEKTQTPDLYRLPHPSFGTLRLPTAAPDPRPVLIAVLAVVAAFVALLDDAAATGLHRVDGLWRAASAVTIVVSATFAGPMAIVVAGAGSAAAAGVSWLLVPAGLAVVLGALSARAPTLGAEGELGAVAGLLVSVAVFRLGMDSRFGVESLAGLAVAGLLVIAAHFYGPEGYRTAVRWIGTLLATAYVVGVLVLLVVAFRTRSDLDAAIDRADEAVQEVRDGDDVAAEESLGALADELAVIDDRMGRPWVQFSRVLPVLGQHTSAASAVVSDGARAAAAAQDVLALTDRDALGIVDGRVDIGQLQRLSPSVDSFAAIADELLVTFDTVDSQWLLPFVRSLLRDAADDISDDVDAAEKVADVIRVAPAMLGADGRRAYLLVFASPAEVRATVGEIGDWALLSADDGRLALERVGRVEELNDILRVRDVELVEPTRYVDRYGSSGVERQLGDATLSPDFPDVAAVVAQLYEEVQGDAVDGVVLADPATAAAMLRLTGPVEVEDRTMSAEEVEQFLLVDQYGAFASETQRALFLTSLLRASVDAFLGTDSGDPWELEAVFGDVLAEDRLAITSFDADEQAVLAGLGATAAFPADDGDDFVAVVAQNAGQNKIDSFMRRAIHYTVVLDPTTGTQRSALRVRVANDAPAAGLPGAVIAGNDPRLPPGTNRQRVVVYSHHPVVGAELDGAPLTLESDREFGLYVSTAVVSIPAGSSVVLVFDMEGDVDAAGGYDLVLPLQATATPDDVTVSVTVPGGQVGDDPGGWSWSGSTSRDQRFSLEVRPG